jgi:hypothetical protein
MLPYLITVSKLMTQRYDSNFETYPVKTIHGVIVRLTAARSALIQLYC